LNIYKVLFIIFIAFWASCSKFKEPDKVKGFIEQKKYDLAIKEAQKESDKAKKFNYLGIIYSKKGDFKKSEEYYNKAIKIDSKNFKALYNLAVLKTKMRKFTEALELLNELEKKYPKNTNIKIKKSWVNYYLLANSNAIAILKETVDENRKILTVYQWKEISKLYENLKRYEAAAEAYDYYISKSKLKNLKIDIKKAQRHLNMLRSERNEEL